jgi:hypothetical protein
MFGEGALGCEVMFRFEIDDEKGCEYNTPGRAHNFVSHEEKLCDDAQNIKMYAKCEKKIPELQDLIQRWSASTKCQHSCRNDISEVPKEVRRHLKITWKSVYFSGQIF